MEFSVLMSIYYKENPDYFEKALKSVINQSLPPTEIVIVKDGPLTKPLESICQKFLDEFPYLIRIVSLKNNQGLGKALQLGVCECKYSLIARMDTDDICKYNRFELQMNEFFCDPELTLLGTSIEEFSNNHDIIDSVRKVPLLYEEIIQYAKKRNPFNHMTVMFRKSAVLAVGNYQPFHFSEDYYLWFRLLQRGYKAKNLPACLVLARVDENMFQRRGGFKYFLQEIKLQKIFYENRFINRFEFMRNLGLRMAARLVPNNFRGHIYRKFLRK